MPWLEKRFEANDLRVVPAPVQVTAASPILIEQMADLI
jgi:hypothetical protein